MLVLLCLFQHGLGDVDFLQVHGVLDMHDSRMLSVNVIAGAQCDLDTALITVGKQRDLRGTQDGRGNHIGVGTININLIYRTLGGYICQSQAIAVAVGIFCTWISPFIWGTA